ncbi:MAG TPA: glycosyltransferase [Acidimicrobiales bacterium]|nr:glycosyltransferase [Acidimicrobiales bacterium]
MLPGVSVVIPAHNNAATIAEQLDALAGQTFDGDWEVVVVDDGSNDGTAEVAARWADKLPSLTIHSLPERCGKSHALNLGTRAARGHRIAYCDADDVASPDWLAGLVSALGQDPLVTGPIDLSRLNALRLYAWRRSPASSRQPQQQQLRPPWMGYLTPVAGCSMAVRREMFDLVSGFDEAVSICDDFDFAFRVQLAGGTVGFAPGAVLHYRLRDRWWSYFRRSFKYGAANAQLYRRFRHRGLARPPLRDAAMRLAEVVFRAPLVLVSRSRYRWLNLAGLELGRLVGCVRHRVFFL